MDTVWSFSTARFTVALEITEDYGYQYDGDDNGETQALLDSGDYVAFDSSVVVRLDGREIGRDSLGGLVYSADEMSDFWTAHRDPDVMNRNSSARPGVPVCIGHYLPEMVRQAIAEARATLAHAPAMRVAA